MKKNILLRSSRVWHEIDRYKWIESQRVGYDIGLEKAVREWLERYADAWVKHHGNKVVKNKIRNSLR
jgi:hypothetical protein